MARYTGPKSKIARRYNTPLFGPTKYLERKNYPPGQHGPKGSRRKSSEYSVALAEKQKLRYQYGILERQFRRTFAEAGQRKGQTGENLLQLLEGRLDSVAYRMGFGVSRAESRQIVRHNGVLVNGKRVNIPSYLVRPGDVVQLTEAARGHLRTKAALAAAESRGFPEWLEVDAKAAKGIFKAYPGREELPPTINEGLVVELYSR